MKKLLFVLLLSGCGTQGYVGQYYTNNAQDFRGGHYPTSFVIRKEINDRFACEFVHLSHIAVGWPFSGEEDTLNMIGATWRLW